MSGLARLVEGARTTLRVPYPAKARILEELASDAEGLYAHFRASGYSAASALREVEARLGVSVGTASELSALYQPLFTRLLTRFAPGRETAAELALLVVTALGLLLLCGLAMTRLSLLGAGSVLPWFVLVAATGAWLAAVAKAFQIVIRGESRIERMRAGLASLLFLPLAAGAAALLSVLTTLYRTVPPTDGVPGEALTMWMSWLRQSSDLLVVALATAIGAGIVWFLLQTRITAIERVERRIASKLATGHPWKEGS